MNRSIRASASRSSSRVLNGGCEPTAGRPSELALSTRRRAVLVGEAASSRLITSCVAREERSTHASMQRSTQNNKIKLVHTCGFCDPQKMSNIFCIVVGFDAISFACAPVKKRSCASELCVSISRHSAVGLHLVELRHHDVVLALLLVHLMDGDAPRRRRLRPPAILRGVDPGSPYVRLSSFSSASSTFIDVSKDWIGLLSIREGTSAWVVCSRRRRPTLFWRREWRRRRRRHTRWQHWRDDDARPRARRGGAARPRPGRGRPAGSRRGRRRPSAVEQPCSNRASCSFRTLAAPSTSKILSRLSVSNAIRYQNCSGLPRRRRATTRA